MKRLLCVVMFTLQAVGVASAADVNDDRTYISLGASYLNVEANPAYALNFDSSSPGLHLLLGYSLSTGLAFELETSSFTDAEDDSAYVFVQEDGADVGELVEATVNLKHNIYTLSVVFNAAFSDQWWGTLRLGASHWELDATATVAESDGSESVYHNRDSGSDLTYRLGVTYWSHQELAWALEAIKHNFDTVDASGVELSMRYHF